MTPEDSAKHRSGGTVADRPETTGRMLALLRERLEETGGVERHLLELAPEDVRRLCKTAGVESGKTDAFRVLVRRRLVRLHGRWRENRSAVRAPVYVEGLTEAGLRILQESGLGEERSFPDRPPEMVADGRKEGERK